MNKEKLVILALLAILLSGMGVVETSMVDARPAQVAEDESSSICMLLGQFRTVFANLLWIKADAYHHEFIEHNRKWSENKELIGLLDMIVALDPHFVEAYGTGAYVYARGYKDDEKAFEYIRRGLVNNPKSGELNRLAALMKAKHLNDPAGAVPYARLAVRYAEDDFSRRVAEKLLHTIEEMAAKQEERPER